MFATMQTGRMGLVSSDVGGPFSPSQTGPTLDLVFNGAPGNDPLAASQLQDDSIDLSFTGQTYQVTVPYAVWVNGAGMTQRNFADIVTFTRASTATYFNSAGTLTTAAINEARFDFNPSTLAAQGFLVEEARTNSILQSENFATTWGVSGSTISTDTSVSPAGTTTADSIVEDATTSAHRVAQSIAADSTLTYTATVFIKSSGRTWATILLDDNSGNGCRGFYNLSTGVVGTLSTSGTSSGGVQSITAVGNGWYRCVITCKPSTVNSANVRILVAGTTGDTVGSYAGTNGLTSVFVWGAQLEAGAFPTSYIPTTTTALTRSADVASVNTLSPWYNQTAGTIVCQFRKDVGTTGRLIVVDNGSGALTTNGINLDLTSATQARTEGFAGGAAQWDLRQTIALGSTQTAAVAYATNDIGFSANGASPTTDNVATIASTGISVMALANWQGALQLNGWLRRVTYYPRRLANADLQTITT